MSKGGSSTTTQTPQIPPELIQAGMDFTKPFTTPLDGVKNGMTPDQNTAADFFRGNVTDNQYLPTLDNANMWLGRLQGNIGDMAGGAMSNAQGTRGAFGSLNSSIGQISDNSFAPLAARTQAHQIGEVGDISGGRGKDFMADYQNPFLKDVVDTSLADYDAGTDRSMAARKAARGAGAAFGTGSDVADAIFSGEASRGRGALSAGLRSNAFNTAAGLGQQDAGRFLQAGMANQGKDLARAQANLQGQFQNDQTRLAAGNSMLSASGQIGNNLNSAQSALTGATAQGLQAAGMMGDNINSISQNAIAGQTLANQNAGALAQSGATPFNQGLDALRVLYSPYGQQQTTTTNDGGASTMGLLGNLGAAALLKWSDIRVKEDVEVVGRLDNGLPVYGFRYKHGGAYQIGLMAQDVETLHPEAVHDIDGIKHVDYRKAVR